PLTSTVPKAAQGGEIAMATDLPPLHPRIRCVTCRQQLPEGTENHPGYFAQYHLKPTGMPPLETAMNFSQELKDLLRYLQALTAVLPEAQEVSEDIVLWLGYLARELAEEALRRREWLAEELDALYEAANGQVKGAREA